MRFKTPRFALAAAGMATLAVLGSAGSANAAAINGPLYNTGLAGYQLQSSVSFNEVRTTISIPAGSVSSSFIDLQETVNGGKTFAIGLVVNPVSHNVYLMGLKGIALDGLSTGVPLPTNVIFPQLVPLPTLGHPAGSPLFTNITGGSYFVEIHYSTRKNLVQFVAGPSETDAATLNTTGAGFLFNGAFNAPAVETLNFASLFGFGAALPISAPQASFSRTGLTEPGGENIKTVGGKRITFDAFPLNEAVATTHGQAPTIGTNPVTLEPSPALPGPGSAFGVATGPQA